jgi:HD-GYP domain-containing protein (c-di-GMP phosphodiesterase class II)
MATEQSKIPSCLTESASDCSVISSLSSAGSKQAKEVKNMSTSVTVSTSKKSVVSQKSQTLNTESKNHGKRSLKRRADEGSQIDDSEEAQIKLESQREYNRVSAARARKRQKDRIANFEEKVRDASYEVNEHQRANDILRTQVDMLVEQNQVLLAERSPDPPASVTDPSAPAPQPAAQARLPMLEGVPVDQLLQIIGALQMFQR